MKKKLIIILTAIAFIITFIVAEILNVYHFFTMPTLLTTIYLISMFSIFEYLLITITYITRKIRKKEKITTRKKWGLVLLFLAILFILLFVIILNVDYLHWYMYSTPFYFNMISRSIEFLIPSIILMIISIKLLQK